MNNEEPKQLVLDMKNLFLLIIKLALPSLASNLITSLYYIVDIKFIGMLNDDALAAVSLTYPINIFVISLGIGTGIGVSSVLSRLLGEQKKEEASIVAGNSIALGIVYGILAMLLGIFFSRSLINFLGSNSEVVNEYAIKYLRISLLGGIGMFLPMIAADILKSEGDTITPMLVLLFGAALNTILDPILMFGLGKIPALGISGAALATTISRLITAFISLFLLFRKKNVIKPKILDIKHLIKSLTQIYYYGLPSTLASMITAAVIGSLNNVVGNYSEDALAFTGVMVTLSDAIIFLPVYGLAQGFIPIASYSFGSKKYSRLRKTLFYTLGISLAISIFGGSLFIFFPKFILKRFITDYEIIKLGTKAFRKVGLSYIFVGPTIICAAAFQSIGHSLQVALAAFMRSILILIPLAYIFGYIGGMNSIWWSYLVTEAISFSIISFWLRHHLKKLPKEDLK